MQKCSPVVMRESLLIVEQFKKVGLHFIPVPIYSDEQATQVKQMADEAFEKIVAMIESEDKTNET